MARPILLLGAATVCLGQTTDYYESIDPESTEFAEDLAKLINEHTVLSYGEIWTAFPVVYGELWPQCNEQTEDLLGDMYSNKCWRIGPESGNGEQCGNYRAEGDCYNREHTFPQAWWGGGSGPEYTDIHHIWPTDGYVNGRRGNLPLCDIFTGSETYISSNGCRVGRCSESEFSGQGFEVAEEFKGELARSIMYMAVAYYDKFTCCSQPGNENHAIRPWMSAVLMRWHRNDPPSPAERLKNDRIYEVYQGNRNPFVDFPEWAELVDFTWGVENNNDTAIRTKPNMKTRRGVASSESLYEAL